MNKAGLDVIIQILIGVITQAQREFSLSRTLVMQERGKDEINRKNIWHTQPEGVETDAAYRGFH